MEHEKLPMGQTPPSKAEKQMTDAEKCTFSWKNKKETDKLYRYMLIIRMGQRMDFDPHPTYQQVKTRGCGGCNGSLVLKTWLTAAGLDFENFKSSDRI